LRHLIESMRWWKALIFALHPPQVEHVNDKLNNTNGNTSKAIHGKSTRHPTSHLNVNSKRLIVKFAAWSSHFISSRENDIEFQHLSSTTNCRDHRRTKYPPHRKNGPCRKPRNSHLLVTEEEAPHAHNPEKTKMKSLDGSTGVEFLKSFPQFSASVWCQLFIHQPRLPLEPANIILLKPSKSSIERQSRVWFELQKISNKFIFSTAR
jgi:hypothetical protein